MDSKITLKNILGIAILLWIAGCARMPLKDKRDAMRAASSIPDISDDLDFSSLKVGLSKNIEFVKSSSRMPSEISFGPTKVSKKKYLKSLENLISESENFEGFKKNIEANFDFYEVYGNEDGWGQILATSYYSPKLKGSLKKTKKLSQPLYYSPKDMATLEIDEFAKVSPKWKQFKEQLLDQRNSKSQGRARVETDKNGLLRILPYFSREDIDEKNAIKDEEGIIVYVDPIDAFFLHIQGSGVVELDDGTQFTVGYSNQNGHQYVAIGSQLLEKIPKEKMSMQSIEKHLRTLSKKEAQKIMNFNPSYVFFQKIDSLPLTYLGTEVVDGRTVATDTSLFPKGTLAFLQFEKPQFSNEESQEPSKWESASRFVFDQDTGGAIKGPARLDLYAGSGDRAAQFAGVMKNKAKLYYLVPKAKYLEKISVE